MSIFSSIPVRRHKSTLFNLSHEVKLTTEMGYLTPIMCQPVLPGDRWQINNEVMIRLAPMVAPIYHDINVYIHHFFVPNRIIWKPFEDFITGGKDGTLAPALPCINPRDWIGSSSVLEDLFKAKSLWDYLGLPTLFPGSWPSNEAVTVSLLPFMAYQKIFQDYYKDENLEDDLFEFPLTHEGKVEKIAGSSGWVINLLGMRRRAWKKDYFTSALPWPQRGADVELPLHGDAPLNIEGDGNVSVSGEDAFLSHVKRNNLQNPAEGNLFVTNEGILQDSAAQVVGLYGANSGKVNVTEIAEKLNGFADLSQVTSATINELRTAIKTQEFLENSARGGARYIEAILSHFGVKSSDARLQRAEFLGGGIVPVQIGNVFQTSQTSADSPQAEMSGTGLAVGASGKSRRRFEEHGYIMSILSIVPRANYMQGIPRDFLKKDKYEWYWPEFANLGEQGIYNAELYSGSANPYGTFGYSPRYAEYKYIPSTIHGDFRDTLKFWHLAREFESEPALNSEFVKVNDKKNGLNRIWNVEDTDFQHFYVLVKNRVKALRRMPRYGVPHF